MDGNADTLAKHLSEITHQIGAGENKAAMDGCAALLRQDPRCAPALHLMGIVASRMGDQGLALSLAERAHAIEPDFREYPAMLAYLCASVGRLSDALYYAKLATVLAPHPHSDALMPAGLPMSRAVFDNVALSLHWLLAESAFHAGNYADAVREGEAELRINAENYDALVTLARAHSALGQHDAAQAHLRTAIQLRPDAAIAHRWMGDVLLALGEHDQALASHRTALALEAEDDAAAACHVLSRLSWQTAGNHSASAEFATALRSRAMGERRPASIEQAVPHIGMLWDRCCAGPLADFLLPVLEHLDNVILYRLNRRADAVTEAARSRVMRFQDCADLDAATFDRIVAGDQPHLLINLCVSADEARFPLLSGAGAPPVLQWLGLPMPDRLPGADLVIGAPATRAADRAIFGADAVVPLPRLLTWRFPATGVAGETVGGLPRDTNGHVVFGAHGDMRRIAADTVALWSSVLRAVPGATLLLGSAEGVWPQPVAERLHAMFSNFGLVGRVTLQGAHEPGAVNLDLLGRVDILLDTAPVNGMNDLAEALWMGVPAVTLTGDRRAGCVGAAILEAAGRADWIAATEADYAAIAARLAESADLAALRADLRDATAASALCDAKGFAALLASALDSLPVRSAHAA